MQYEMLIGTDRNNLDLEKPGDYPSRPFFIIYIDEKDGHLHVKSVFDYCPDNIELQ